MADETRSRLRGDLLAVLCAFVSGAGLTPARIALDRLAPVSFNTYMFLFGAVFVLLEIIFTGKGRILLRISFWQLLYLGLIAVIFAAGMFCYMTSLTLVGPATVSFISRLELVVTIVLAGIFLRERLNRWELIGLVIVAAGIVIMRYGASVELSRAILLIILGTIFMGSGEVLIKSRIDWIDPRTFVFYRNIWMAIIYAVSSMLMGKSLGIPDTHTAGMIVIAAFFMTYLGRLTYLWTMRNIPVSRAAIIVQSQPFFAGAIALVFLDVFPSVREIAGGLCIVAGVVFIRLLDRHKKSSAIADPEDSQPIIS